MKVTIQIQLLLEALNSCYVPLGKSRRKSTVGDDIGASSKTLMAITYMVDRIGKTNIVTMDDIESCIYHCTSKESLAKSLVKNGVLEAIGDSKKSFRVKLDSNDIEEIVDYETSFKNVANMVGSNKVSKEREKLFETFLNELSKTF